MLLHQVLHDDPRPPRRLNDKIPRDLETVCLKAIAREPGRRFGTAGALAEDLRRWLRGEAILARPVGPAERLLRWCRRYPAVAGLTAAVVLSLLAGTAVAAALALQARNTAAEEARARRDADQHAGVAKQNESRALAAEADAKQKAADEARARKDADAA